MPSLEHDGVVELFRDKPELGPYLLERIFHLPVPAHTQVRIADSSLGQLLPIEFDMNHRSKVQHRMAPEYRRVVDTNVHVRRAADDHSPRRHKRVHVDAIVCVHAQLEAHS